MTKAWHKNKICGQKLNLINNTAREMIKIYFCVDFRKVVKIQVPLTERYKFSYICYVFS